MRFPLARYNRRYNKLSLATYIRYVNNYNCAHWRDFDATPIIIVIVLLEVTKHVDRSKQHYRVTHHNRVLFRWVELQIWVLSLEFF